MDQSEHVVEALIASATRSVADNRCSLVLGNLHVDLWL